MTFAAGSKILLPFDGSEPAVDAARHVAMHAKASKVHLLNVQDAIIPGSAFAAASYVIVQWHRRHGETILRSATEILAAGDLLIEPEVAFGRPAQTICRFARARACNVIVLGTRARHPLVSLFSGSVACEVTRGSTVPVLLLRSARAASTPVPAISINRERSAPAFCISSRGPVHPRPLPLSCSRAAAWRWMQKEKARCRFRMSSNS
jgi:nucleotide-binding universal stress UspA family protein